MSSTLISDYQGYGTHAARPASLNIAAGATALYYETDTSLLFAWNGSAWVQINSGSNPFIPAIVQAAAGLALAGSVTFGAAPVQGHLLIAMVANQGSSLINGSGWNKIMAANGTQDGFGWGYKIAGASESTTQTPTTEGAAGAVIVWELTLGDFGVWAYSITASSSTTPSLTFSTFRASQLCLGYCDGPSAFGAPSGVSGIDHYTNVIDSPRSITYFDVSPGSAGSHTATLTYGTSEWFSMGLLTIG